jgi:hypothetical protein
MSRVGKLDVVKCEELGLRAGPKFMELKDGLSVLTDDGRIVHAHQVIYLPSPLLSMSFMTQRADMTFVSYTLIRYVTFRPLFPRCPPCRARL